MPRRSSPNAGPLDQAALDRLALRYVERFATTRARLADYLARKVRQQGWTGPAADPATIAERLASLGYIDDRVFAEARAAAMARRGLGARRVAQALHHAGVHADDARAIKPDIDGRATEAALAFARRRRFGPFASTPPDRVMREKQVGAMVRAGHDSGLSRKIVSMDPGSELEMLSEER